MSRDHIRDVQEKRAMSMPQARVLLVHEDARLLAHNQALLWHAGCKVTACSNWDDEVRCLESGLWHLVIVSQGTRAFEGKRVLERAIEMDRYTPVIVLARWCEMSCYVTAMHLGALDYVEEPLSTPQLVRIVEAYARKRATVVQ